MALDHFPALTEATDDGLIAIGGDLEVSSLVCAYHSGIFPWPLDDRLLTWFAPPKRALLFCQELHIPRTLKRERRRTRYRYAIDERFEEVITRCAAAHRPHQLGTWITPDMTAAYIELHRANLCHSIECYDGCKLVGGIYGVSIGAAFSAESMFHIHKNTSKLCLWFLVEFLREHNVNWIDCQVINPFLASMGVREVLRAEFMQLLQEAKEKSSPFTTTKLYPW